MYACLPSARQRLDDHASVKPSHSPQMWNYNQESVSRRSDRQSASDPAVSHYKVCEPIETRESTLGFTDIPHPANASRSLQLALTSPGMKCSSRPHNPCNLQVYKAHFPDKGFVAIKVQLRAHAEAELRGHQAVASSSHCLHLLGCMVSSAP